MTDTINPSVLMGGDSGSNATSPTPTTPGDNKGSMSLTGPESSSQAGASERVKRAKRLEALGNLKPEVVSNDGTLNSLRWILGLKYIFQKQLPRMPREYIMRLLYDRRHQSLLLIRDGVEVVGGITFRPFHAMPKRDEGLNRKPDEYLGPPPGMGFIEIVFCAVNSNEQVQGFGSYMMAQMKEVARRMKLYHMLTYADNYAVGYFKKQGFSTEIAFDRKHWEGAIKDYEGGTLMYCRVDPRICYTDVHNVLQKQRDHLFEKLKPVSHCHVMYPGITFPADGRPLTPAEIPGLREANYVQPSSDPQEEKRAYKNMQRILEELKAHPDARSFLYPVTVEEAPDYYDVIKDPMDFSTISKRFDKPYDESYYKNKEIFAADVMRIFQNCRFYNKEGTIYVLAADALEKYFLQRMTHYNMTVADLYVRTGPTNPKAK